MSPPGEYDRQRLKLKGIDGGPHKRWSMWFNSMIREEPYLDSNVVLTVLEIELSSDRMEGAAWLSSARAARCWVKSRNERNPYLLVAIRLMLRTLERTACASREEGGDDVKSSWPLRPGQHTCYNGRDNGQQASR